MKQEEILKIIELKQEQLECEKVQHDLENELSQLESNEIVKRYFSLIQEIKDISYLILRKSTLANYIDKADCRNREHNGVLLYKGRQIGDCKICICLNCKKEIDVRKQDADKKRILDLNLSYSEEMISNIIEKYHLLRDCYYKYPNILKEHENKDRIIYKVMKKRYDTKK